MGSPALLCMKCLMHAAKGERGENNKKTGMKWSEVKNVDN
jgi:hypothetical protein